MIYIVEDDAAIRELEQYALQSSGYEVARLGENIILAAWAKGIGSCCLGSSARWILDSPSAKPYLDRMAFSKGYKLLYCIALGYPAETPKAKPRRDDMIKFMD